MTHLIPNSEPHPWEQVETVFLQILRYSGTFPTAVATPSLMMRVCTQTRPEGKGKTFINQPMNDKY